MDIFIASDIIIVLVVAVVVLISGFFRGTSVSPRQSFIFAIMIIEGYSSIGEIP